MSSPGRWRDRPRRVSKRGGGAGGGGPLTDEEVPLGVQVGLVGQAAPHHVAAVVLAGFEARQPAAVGTVHHPGQGRAAAWNHVHLQGKK